MANYTILLIDYEPRSIERFREPLVGAGYGIEIATDGVSGIEAFHRLNPDMVLVEAMIPKKHGFEVCQELKRTPHGRKTPVIITTGVYKGRKYRTQALHIYGCDEYIEKPIAPEQLLEIVGRFLKPGPSGSPPKSPQSGPGQTESGGSPGSHETSGSVAKAVSSAQTHTSRGPSINPTAAPHALANDDREDEIMARLDALLPGGDFGMPEVLGASTATLAEAVTPIAVAPVEPGTASEEDPFAKMRAELNAELGALTTALDFESSPVLESIPEPMPSDQVVSPSLLEALPLPEAELPPPPPPEPPPDVAVERPGQVVDFDTKRSRKHKKASKHQQKTGSREGTSPARAAQAISMGPTHGAATPRRMLEPVASVAEMTLPRGTLVESQLEAPVAGRGMPVWVWAAAGIVAVVGLYFVFSRDMPDRSAAIEAPAPLSKRLASAPIEPPPPPQAPSPAAAVVDQAPPPVAQTIQAPAPKKPVEPPPTAKPPVAGPAPARAVAKKESGPPPAAAVTAPVGLGDSEAGVEALPDPAITAPPATISAGALIPIDEVDTMPVPLSRRLPVYSEQAKQMRLSGTVVLNALINEQGKVEQVVLVIGVPGADLNESAMRAAKTWTYRPATKHGVPVKVWKSEQIVFKR